MMLDVFGNVLAPALDDVIVSVTDGVTGSTDDRSESLYASPYQRLIGWAGLHLYPLITKKWKRSEAEAFYTAWLPDSIPGGCSCGTHWAKIIESDPPRYESRGSFFRWTVRVHNAVNRILNVNGTHPKVTQAQARDVWSRIAAAWPVAWWRPIHGTPIGGSRLLITVATGPARESLSITRPMMEAYAARCGADFVALVDTTQSWWGLEKFRVAEYAATYDQTLFIDSDVLIKPDAPDLFSQCRDADIAIHDDFSDLPSTAWMAGEFNALMHCVDPLQQRERYSNCYNSGVVLTSRAAASIWSPPSLPMPTSHCAEQFWVQHQIDKQVERGSRLTVLGPEWNTQFWMEDFEPRREVCHFIHGANAPSKPTWLRRQSELLAGR